MQTGGGPNPRTAQGVARLGTVGPGGTGVVVSGPFIKKLLHNHSINRGGRCAVVVRDAMRGPLRTGCICAMRCAVVIARCAARSLYGMRCADWLHLRGVVASAGSAMLLTEGF